MNATSRLFKNENGHFVLDKANAGVFKDVGMVTSAVFCDLNGDGEPDLILATEWGPIKIFINNNGVFHNETKKWGSINTMVGGKDLLLAILITMDAWISWQRILVRTTTTVQN